MIEKNKILIYALPLTLGGSITHLRNLLLNTPTDILKRITIITGKANRKNFSDIEVTLYIPNMKNKLVNRILWQYFIFPRIVKHYDIVYFPGGIINNFSRLKGKTTITMFRNMLPFDELSQKQFPFHPVLKIKWLLQKKMMLNSYENATKVIFISQYGKDVINKFVKTKECVVIPHGVNKLNNISKDVENNENTIVYVSQVNYYKNQLNVIHEFKEILLSTNTNFKLIFIGNENKYYSHEIKEKIARLNLQNNVIMLGQLDNNQIEQICMGATFLLFASSSENCPNTLLELMRYNKPLFCSEIMPMPEFAKKSVLYFNPLQKGHLFKVFISNYNNKNLLQSLCLSMNNEIKNYSWTNCAQKTWKFILG